MEWVTFKNMDKSWMETNHRITKSYADGVTAFIDYAVNNLRKTGKIDPLVKKEHLIIPCPCINCINHVPKTVEEVQYHLFRYGIDKGYTNWIKHGEKKVGGTNFASVDIHDTDVASDN